MINKVQKRNGEGSDKQWDQLPSTIGDKSYQNSSEEKVKIDKFENKTENWKIVEIQLNGKQNFQNV